MNQVNGIFRNTVALAVADLAGRAGNILLAFFLARHLHAVGFGIYSTAMAYYGLIAVAGAMGAESFLVREMAREPSKTSRYVIHFSAIGLTFSTLLILSLFLTLPHLGYAEDQAASIRIIMLAIAPGILSIIHRALFIAHQRVLFLTYARLISVLLNVSISLYLLLSGYGIVSLILAFVIQEYVGMIAYTYFVFRFITPLQWTFEWSFAVRLVRDIRTFVALSLLSALFSRPEVLILSLLSNHAQVGYYSAASKIVDMWHFLPEIYMTNIYPLLSRSYHVTDPRCEVIQDKSVKYVMCISLPLSAGTFVLAQPIIQFLYGASFGPSVSVLQILALTLPIHALAAVLWRVLGARDQQHLDLHTRIVSLVARLGAGYVLIRLLAALGASMSAAASVLLNACLLAYYVNQGEPKVHAPRVGFRCALAAAGMALITWLLRHHIGLWGLIPLAGTIYGLLVYVLRVLSPGDVNLIRRIWQPDAPETT